MTARLDQVADAPAKPLPFRADIQGLRAVAVIVVIMDHLFGWPAGGFIGVDVFFVISGFLLTGLMLREYETTGSISWVNFYKRRVRRIVPAATVCLVVVVAASYLIYRVARFDAIVDDAVWSFFFMSNWHFAAVGTDYWASTAVSPLQHFWSLAVEEQFYIVWPVVLIALLGGLAAQHLRRHDRSVKALLAVVSAGAIAASFGWAIFDTAAAPTWAYFSTFTRGWELAVGALLAVAVGRLSRLPPAARPLLSYAGLVLIVAGLFVITPASAFPGPWAVLPVVGAAFVIAAGAGGSPRHLLPLTNPGSVYVGKISYSLYLWHFPVIVLLAAVIPTGTIGYYGMAIIVMVVLALVSFYLVENAVRRSTWLDPAGRRNSRRRQHRKGAGLGYAAIAALTVLTVTACIFAFQVPVAESVVAAPPSGPVQPSTVATPGGSEQAALSAQIDAALATTEWPDLQPSIDEVTAGTGYDVCTSHPDNHACVSNADAPQTAYVIGDSTARRLSMTVKAALWDDYKVVDASQSSCGVAPIDRGYINDQTRDDCHNNRKAVLDKITATRPELVFLISTYEVEGSLSSGATGAAAAAEWRSGLESVLPGIVGSAGKVILISGPPYVKYGLESCATKTSRPPACVTKLGDQWARLAKVEADVAASLGVVYWDTSRWYCSVDNYCPSFVGTTPVRIDNLHLTDAYAAMLVPVFRERFADTVAGQR